MPRKALLLLALLFSLPSLAAPSVVASQVIAGAASTTGETPSFTVSGSNRVLYAAVILSDGPPSGVTNCKWGGSGGTAMTQIYDSGVVESFLELVWFRLIAPAASTTTVHCTFAASTSEYGVIAVATQDTDQTTPNGTIAGAHSNGYTPDPTVSVTSATGGLVIDAIGRFSNGNMTEGAGQTVIRQGQVSNVLNVSSSSEAGAASVAMSWSGNAAGTVSNYQWVTAGIPLNPPGAALPATDILLQLLK
jgi:hypothetical protein